jgi:hypothetical protein
VGKLACLRTQSAAAAGSSKPLRGRLFFSLIQNPLSYTPFFICISLVCLFSYTFPEPLRTAGILNPQERRNIMMTDWYERTIKTLRLNGKGERTQ